MNTAPWTEDPPGARQPEAECRGCAKPIWRLAGLDDRWEDASGGVVCVKSGLASIGRGRVPEFVFHVPMPTGLRGGPK